MLDILLLPLQFQFAAFNLGISILFQKKTKKKKMNLKNKALSISDLLMGQKNVSKLLEIHFVDVFCMIN